MKTILVWFRKDLRLDDNTALSKALAAGLPVLPVYIFDTSCSDDIDKFNPAMNFVCDTLAGMNAELKKHGGRLIIRTGNPVKILADIIEKYDVTSVYCNREYEPYSVSRDNLVKKILEKKGISFFSFKDRVIYEGKEITREGGEPYTVFTPYSKKWLGAFEKDKIHSEKNEVPSGRFLTHNESFHLINYQGPISSSLSVRNYDLSVMNEYEKFRDIPAKDRTSYLSPHLRYGTVSIRKIVLLAYSTNRVFLNELIWREFFMQILANFPHVVTDNFRSKYDNIEWRNDEHDFERWCGGETGYPIVDAGMRQLNETGYMHNRVRMITAGFLCKHLLIDWRWGEAYFATRLLDFELSSNNGNWQWAAGTGCDAAPYFRIFSPESQEKRFDPAKEYILRWVKEIGKQSYPKPVVDHAFARNRALEVYKRALRNPLPGKHNRTTTV